MVTLLSSQLHNNVYQIQKMQPKLIYYVSIIVSSTAFSNAFHNPYRSTSTYTSTLHQSFYKTKTVQLFSSSSSSSSSSQDDPIEKAKIVFLGTPEVAAASLQTIVKESRKDDSNYDIVSVVTQPPKRRKRRGKVIPSPVGEMAEQLEIPILCPEKANEVDFLDELEYEIQPDLCITAAYGNYLPKRFLRIPKFGTVNIHPSLLPKYRGASPVQRSLAAGENPVGVSILFTVTKMDAGPIIAQIPYTIQPDEEDDASAMLPLLFDMGTQSLLENLPSILNGTITMEKNVIIQNEDEVIEAPLIDSSEGELRVCEDSALTCHNKVRGFSMWPGTFMYFKIGDDVAKVKIAKTRVVEDLSDVENTGRHVVLIKGKKRGLGVFCGDGSLLEILMLQPVTKNVMDAKSFVNGLQGKSIEWVEGEDSA